MIVTTLFNLPDFQINSLNIGCQLVVADGLQNQLITADDSYILIIQVDYTIGKFNYWSGIGSYEIFTITDSQNQGAAFTGSNVRRMKVVWVIARKNFFQVPPVFKVLRVFLSLRQQYIDTVIQSLRLPV